MSHTYRVWVPLDRACLTHVEDRGRGRLRPSQVSKRNTAMQHLRIRSGVGNTKDGNNSKGQGKHLMENIDYGVLKERLEQAATDDEGNKERQRCVLLYEIA